MKKLFPCILILVASIQTVYAVTPAQTNTQSTPSDSKTLQMQTEQQIKAAQEAQAAKQFQAAQQTQAQLQVQQQLQATPIYQMKPADSVIPSQDQLQESQIILPTLITQSLFQSNSSTSTTNPSIPKNGKGIYYTVDYDPSSKIKDIPLKNISMNVEVYYYGNPEGRMNIQLDDSQNFVFDKYPENSYLALEVLSLSDQNQYHAKCSGLASPRSNKLKIKCDHNNIYQN